MLNVKDLNKQDENSTGIVFIDGVGEADISDYTNYGPNHEVYLAANQSVSFIVNSGAAEKLASIQLGVKALNSSATVSIAAVGDASREISTNSATDLYYDITNIAKDSKVVVITNTGSSLVSLTNIKVTHTAAAPTAAEKTVLTMNAPAARMAVSYVNSMYLAAAPVEQVPEKTAEEPATTGEVLIPEKNDTTQNTDVVQTGGEAADTAKTPENVAGIPANGEDTQLDKGETTEQNDSAANDSETVDSTEAVTEESHRTFGQVIMDILSSIIDWITGLFRR